MDEVQQSDIDALHASGMFDSEWYRKTYPDVDQTGIDPAEHYLRYGHLLGRDPGPEFSTTFARIAFGVRGGKEPVAHLNWLRDRSKNAVLPKPEAVLLAAYEMSLRGDHDRAIQYAERYVPKGLSHTVHALKSNRHLHYGQREGWLEELNRYLASFKARPVQLSNEGSLFDQLGCRTAPSVSDGPLISVIMPAWNASRTIDMAVSSILKQSWTNLELIVIDDCSQDDTFDKVQALAASDSRIRPYRNRTNVGPYVSKNLGLQRVQGAWVTGHDADDWAHPDRLERHMKAVFAESAPPPASFTYMIRLDERGHFDTFSRVNEFSPDGVTRRSSISALFERSFLVERLGFWDSVRFAADSELISRARRILGNEIRDFRQIGMLCLSAEGSLTNHPEFGIRTPTGFSSVRGAYKDAWTEWHAGAEEGALKLSFPHFPRRFAAPESMVVPPEDIQADASA